VTAALAMLEALFSPPALILILSRTQRQSAELLRKVLDFFNMLGRPVPTVQPKDSALKLELGNGSRIISLPSGEETIRSFSGVRLLVIDEAARVPEDLYRAVRPMLAVSHGRLICLSTPFGKQGWFHKTWHSSEPWERIKITARECPRISEEFLAEERRELGERWYNQEYFCSFEETTDSVFAYEDIEAAMALDVPMLAFPE
jgi:phage FluMu gp28-like protein